MKTVKKILRFKVMVFPDESFFDVKDILIGAVVLGVFLFINQ